MKNPIITLDGTKYWYNSDGQIHRDDGPAIEYQSGTKFYWINGKLHRKNDQDLEYQNVKCWWIKGIEITDEVNQWIKDNNFPEYEQWDDSIKVLFKLTFG